MPQPGERYSIRAVDENGEPVSDEEVLTIQAPISEEKFQEILRLVASEVQAKFPDDSAGFSVEIYRVVDGAEWRSERVPFSQLLK